jgi:dehydrogenase/reductase SDR family member 4
MVKTAFSQPLWGDKAILDDVTRLIPMGRIAEPEEVAGIVLFLGSDLSTFITGEVITVDGGSMA